MSLYPVYLIGYGVYIRDLGPEPIDYIINTSGEWALGMLVLTLAMTPLRKVFKNPEFSRYKKMFGLFTFFYATLHLLTHVGLDYRFDMVEVFDQIVKKKFMLVGFIAWVLLLPLAITSNLYSIRLLKNKWKQLHKLVYVVAILSILHYLWLVKTIIYEPLVYTIIVIVLLTFRLRK